MIYADDADGTTTDKTIVCIASTGEWRAVRFLLYVRCGNIINAPKYYTNNGDRPYIQHGLSGGDEADSRRND